MFRALLLTLLGAACTSEPGASPFKAATDRDAERVVQELLDAAKAKDTAGVAAHVCAPGDDAKNLAIQSYLIMRVEPAWVGGEPYYRVDVDLERASGHDERSFAVRAREGCVDRLLGEPIESARQRSGEISL